MISIRFQDLAPSQLIDVLSNLHSYTVIEQLDGTEVVIGFDKNSKLYFQYQNAWYMDYEKFGLSPHLNGLRSAFLAITVNSHLLHTILGSNSAIRCKVLYGKQPNVICYGDNRIVFQEVIFAAGDYTKIMQSLEDTLANKPVSVESVVAYTNNGSQLLNGTEHHIWQFSMLPVVWSFDEIFTIEDLNPEISAELTALRNWLNRRGIVISQHHTCRTNGEYLDIDTRTLPIEDISVVQNIKNSIDRYYRQVFVTSIHDTLVSWLMDNKLSAFATIPIKRFEFVGVKGIYLQHKQTGFCIEIDNEPSFTRIQSFYRLVRNNIFSTEKYESFNISFGVAKNVIGDLLSTLHDAFHDVHYDPLFAIQQMLAARSSLERLLLNYMRSFKYLRLSLSTGQEIGYTESVHYQTLVCFAETFEKLRCLIETTTQDTTEQEFVKNIQDKFGKSVFK